MGRPDMQAMRAKLAEAGQAQASKLDEAIASKGHEAIALKADKPMDASTVATKSKPKAEPEAEAGKVKKRSTSLYLSGAASRVLHTIAAKQGVRPHRVIDDALRAEFKRHGEDFDRLNAMD